MQCLNNLKQWGLALNAYHNDYGSFPVGNVEPPNYDKLDWTGGWWGFQAKILPYIEANDIYKLCNFNYKGPAPSIEHLLGLDDESTTGRRNPGADDHQPGQMSR